MLLRKMKTNVGYAFSADISTRPVIRVLREAKLPQTAVICIICNAVFRGKSSTLEYNSVEN